MTRRLNLLYLIIPVLCAIQGCVVMRECSIDTMQPAKVALAPPREAIAVYASPTLLSDAIMSNSHTEDVYADSIIDNILYTLKALMEQAPGFERTSVTVFITDRADMLPQTFDWYVELNRLLLRNAYYMRSVTSDAFETYSETSLQTHYVARWLVHNAKGGITDSFEDRDLLEWSSGLQYHYATDMLSVVEASWIDAGTVIAHACARYLTPHWQHENRYVYLFNKFPDLSIKAYEAMQSDSYTRAFNIWEDMLLSCRKRGQKRRKSRIAYNMAVTCEMDDRLDDALHWAQQSLDYREGWLNYIYLNGLKTRKLQKEALDKQLDDRP